MEFKVFNSNSQIKTKTLTKNEEDKGSMAYYKPG